MTKFEFKNVVATAVAEVEAPQIVTISPTLFYNNPAADSGVAGLRRRLRAFAAQRHQGAGNRQNAPHAFRTLRNVYTAGSWCSGAVFDVCPG